MLVSVTEKTTVPLKLLLGVAVMVTAGMVPPDATVTVPVLAEMAKSGQEEVVTVTSTGLWVKVPFADCVEPPPVRSGPFDPW